MGESQYSASVQSASTRSYATADTSYVTQKIIPLYLKNVPAQTFCEAVKQIKNIYIMHLLLFQENVDKTSFYAILITFLELVTYTLAEAHSQMSKKHLQGFVLNHQAFVADIYLLYNFFTLLFMQLVVSCVLGVLYNFILPMLTENKEIKNYYIYYLIMVLSAPVTSSMAIYVENVMDISRQQMNSYVIRIMDPIMTMIVFNIFLLIKPESFTNVTLYIILATIQSIIYLASYIRQFMLLIAKRRNKLPIRLNMRNFKPFRGILFARMLYQQTVYIISCGAEYVNALLVVVYTQQDYSSRLYYPNIVMCTFLFIRSLTKTGKSLQFASKRFLEAYIESNLIVNQINRIYEMLTKGLLVHIALNLAIVGVVYWISIPVANMLFSRDKFTTDEYAVVLNVNKQATISALCIFAHIITPFNQAMIYIYNNKFTRIMKYSHIVIDWAIIIAFIVLQKIDPSVYMYINYYTVYEVTNGFANALFFIILLCKYSKYNKQFLNNSPLLVQDNEGHQQKQDSEYVHPEQPPVKQSEVIYQLNKLSTKVTMPNLDELFALPSAQQDSDIFNSSTKSKDRSKSHLRKSRLNHEDVDIDDTFQLRNSMLIKNDNE